MSKAYRSWKAKRQWGMLHKTGFPSRMFTMRNYRRWKRYYGRHIRLNRKWNKELKSSIMPHEWADATGDTWDKEAKS